jgi:predicted nucleotidyltransferase component of viral defense system
MYQRRGKPMIEIIKQQFTRDMTPEAKLNRTREMLQLATLRILHDQGALNNLAFTGGTALRIIFDMRRFSEDMDFSLVDKTGYDFPKTMAELTRGFNLYGLKVETQPKEERTVHSAFFKFTGLLKELGLSPLAGQKFSLKLEIDSNPPQGGQVTSTFVNKTYPLMITHFDLPSMFATKLHACFFRKYLKGRDYYDFVWYLGKRIKPNYTLLNNAIKQTQGDDPGITESTLKGYLLKNIEKVDFKAARGDVERFLEDKSEIDLLNFEPIKSTIESFY